MRKNYRGDEVGQGLLGSKNEGLGCESKRVGEEVKVIEFYVYKGWVDIASHNSVFKIEKLEQNVADSFLSFFNFWHSFKKLL